MNEHPKIKQVKGTILVPYQTLIKENPQLNWDAYLTAEDWAIINARIHTTWYSFETFQRCGLAAFHLLANKNLKAVMAWSKATAKNIFGIYKFIVQETDPIIAIIHFFGIKKMLFNFDLFSMEVKKISSCCIQTTSRLTDPDYKGAEAFAWQINGWLCYIIEQTGGQVPRIKFLSQQWKGDPDTRMDISWE